MFKYLRLLKVWEEGKELWSLVITINSFQLKHLNTICFPECFASQLYQWFPEYV